MHKEEAIRAFGSVFEIPGGEEYAFLTEAISEREYEELAAGLVIKAHIRMIK